MRNNIVISSDCACDLPESLLKQYSIRTIPFYIMINEARFQECTEIESRMIVECFENTEDKFSSAPASVEEYKSYFLENTKENDVQLIHISVSGKMSDAFRNASAAAENMENVYVMDSGLFSHGIGLFVLAAVKLVNDGATVEQVCTALPKLRDRISCSFALNTTQYAAKNDRVNQTVSYLLDLFRIKPILKVKKGVLKVDGICISNMKTYARKYVRKKLRNKEKICDDILFITISGCSEEFKKLICEEATKDIPWRSVYIQDVAATNLCNVGPGSFGIMFFKK